MRRAVYAIAAAVVGMIILYGARIAAIRDPNSGNPGSRW
jgi:hypothetical protein